ncbi:MAG: hypothetical protein WAM82_35660 [Thermoanaerobaculia bacterium]
MIRTARQLLVTALFAAGAAQARVAVELPAITPDSVFHGGKTLALNGLSVSTATLTHLTFMNLAATGNRCSLALTTADGTSMGPVTSLTLRPKESLPFFNVFERLTEAFGTTEAQAKVSCDQDFYAYALQAEAATGRMEVVAPQETKEVVELADTLPECPAGAICSDAPGVDFIPGPPPGPPLPVGRVTFPAPKGSAKRFRMSIDVTVGPWYAQEPFGKHLIYWFVINNNKDMPGLLYFLGPNKNQAFARHGLQLTHPQKLKVIRPFAAQVGHTYHVVNDYDLVSRSFSITITDKATGEVAVVLPGRTNLQTYTIKANSNFLIDMGFYPGKVPSEVPSYAWVYSNIHIETYLR